MSGTAIFLSASVPRRTSKYSKTSDPIAITLAVLGLTYVTLGRRLLVWGGHPAITPMIWAVAEDMGVDYGAWVHLYQSRLYEAEFPRENSRFRNVTLIDAVGKDRDLSLAEMRKRMIGDYQYQAGVFIGGMEGVEEEFDLFRKAHPNATLLPIASTGGAALVVYQRDPDPSEELMNSRDYVELLQRRLQIPPREPRRPFVPSP